MRLLADLVRRLRRVALHLLALEGQGGNDDIPLPGPYLCKLISVEGTLKVRPDRSATMRSPLPDEVRFESLDRRPRRPCPQRPPEYTTTTAPKFRTEH